MPSSQRPHPQDTHLQEILEIQNQLREALQEVMKGLQNKLKPEELDEIKAEYQTLINLFESLKEGKIKIVLFGKTNAGKSSVANSILGADVYNVDVGMGAIVKADGIIDYGKWKIIDSPGFMHSKSDDDQAVHEIKNCHGRIFVLDSEPFEPELKMFDDVASLFEAPTIVFFNKWDSIERNMPTQDREKVRKLVIQKMSKYVTEPNKDIIFGSARPYDPQLNKFIRQDLQQLIDRMYDTAGDLGLVVNVINPAEKASNRINTKLYETREKIARRIISDYSKLCAWGSIIPFSSVTTTPAFIHNMNLAICNIMGVNKEDTLKANKISDVFNKAINESIEVEVAWSTIAVITAPFTFGMSLGVAALGTAAEWDNNILRTQVVGEALLEYIRSDFKPMEMGDINTLFDNLRKKIKEQGLYSRNK
jgi:small GTP-binding protein